MGRSCGEVTYHETLSVSIACRFLDTNPLFCYTLCVKNKIRIEKNTVNAFSEQPYVNSPRGKKVPEPSGVPESSGANSSRWRGIVDPDAARDATAEVHEEQQRALQAQREQARLEALQRQAAEARRKRAEQQNEADQDRVRELLNSDPTHPDLEEYQQQIIKRNTDAGREPHAPQTEQPPKKG
jgi:hypothetical protein